MKNVQERLERLYINLSKSRHYTVPVTRDSSQQPNLKEVCGSFARANIQEPNTFGAEYDYILGESRGSHVFTDQPKPQLSKRAESLMTEPQYEGIVESKLYDHTDERITFRREKRNNQYLARGQQKLPVSERMPKRATFQEPNTSRNNDKYDYVAGEVRGSYVSSYPLKSHQLSKRAEFSMSEPQYEGIVESKLYDHIDESLMSEPQYEGIVESKLYDHIDESLMSEPQYEGIVESKLYDHIDESLMSEPQYEGIVESKIYDCADDTTTFSTVNKNNPYLTRGQQKPPVPEMMPKRATFQEHMRTRAFRSHPKPQYEGIVESQLHDHFDPQIAVAREKQNNVDLTRYQPERIPKVSADQRSPKLIDPTYYATKYRSTESSAKDDRTVSPENRRKGV